MRLLCLSFLLFLPTLAWGQLTLAGKATLAGVVTVGQTASSWTPSDWSALSFWLESESQTNKSNGQRVLEWTNWSGTYAFTNYGTAAPVVSNSVFSSYPAVCFTNGATYMWGNAASLGAARNVAGYTIACVAIIKSSDATDRSLFFVSRTNSASYSRANLHVNNGLLRFHARRVTGDNVATASLAIANDVPYRIIAVMDPPNGKIYLWTNGVSAASGTNSLATSGATTEDGDSLRVMIGSDATASVSANLGAIIVGNEVPSDATRANLDTYLKKYVP